MVDERRLNRLLRRVSTDVLLLRERGAAGASAVLADRALLDSVKYVLVTAIEGCIRAAQHVAASEGWEPPGNNADAFRVLAAHGVIDDRLAGELAGAAGLRNLLIREYADIDEARVVEQLDALGDLDAFVDAVAAWVAPPQSPGGS